MQLELELQSNITRRSQVLHYNGRDVTDFMSANDVVYQQLQTSEDQPLALLPTTLDSREHQSANIQRILRKAVTFNNITFLVFVKHDAIFRFIFCNSL